VAEIGATTEPGVRRAMRSHRRPRLATTTSEVVVRLVWDIVKAVSVGAVAAQLACFVVALYEMLNLPEMRRVPLTLGAVAGAVRGLGVETIGTIVAVLAIPLGALPWRRMADDVRADRPPIVFVPGYCMTRSSMWILHRRLAGAGWRAAVGYNYRTFHGDLRAAGRGLAALIADVAATHGASQVVVIAHGMGGLVARLCLREQSSAYVRTLVTLGTPHQGSKLNALALDPMAQEMRPGSELLEALACDEARPDNVELIAIYSSFDLTVIPSSAGQYPGASNIEVEGVGHVGLLWSARVFELVHENLEFAHAARLAGTGDADPSRGAPQAEPSARTQRATSSASE
jgi:triacylglycerol esterase/lipase EstA (alpha/beta hydrolase family)